MYLHDESPTPLPVKRAPRVMIIRGGEPDVPPPVFDAAVRAQLLVTEVAFEEVVPFLTEHRPLAVIVFEPLFFRHAAMLEDVCRAVDARLIVLPHGAPDDEMLLSELRIAADRHTDTE